MASYHADVVILGSGISARTAAETLRLHRPNLSVIIASQEQAILRPLLSKADLHRIPCTSFSMGLKSWCVTNHITYLECRITALNAPSKTVQTSFGEIRYGSCIYALGSHAFLPPFVDHILPGIFTVRTIHDITALKIRLTQARRAVIIGGGIIGLEVGQMLAAYGTEVTILESQPWLMPRILDFDTADEYRKRLHPLRIETGIAIKSIHSTHCTHSVELTDGRCFPCDAVIVSCGVRPDTAIAYEAGLQVQRAVVVSDQMRTSDPAIYACGDCAQHNNSTPALWRVASEQGRIAALNICGIPAYYQAPPTPVVFYASQNSLFAMGTLAPPPSPDVQVVTQRRHIHQPYLVNCRTLESYSRLVFKNGTLIGAALIGDLSRMDTLQQQLSDTGKD